MLLRYVNVYAYDLRNKKFGVTKICNVYAYDLRNKKNKNGRSPFI